MEIDNFDMLMARMDFVDPNDRYIVHIFRRPKDCRNLAQLIGSEEVQMMIHSHYIDSLDSLKSKIPSIKELCTCCRARAYLVVQPKDNRECLFELGKKILDSIQKRNYSIRPDRLLRQAYCGNHHTRKKLWILDLDKDTMTERWIENNFGGKYLQVRSWNLDDVIALVKEMVGQSGRNPDDVYCVTTRNGWHIITPPFNLQDAQEKCRMIFEGEKDMPIKCEEKWKKKGDKGYTGTPGLDRYYEIDYCKVVGWLHHDGMTLLYAPDTI